MKLTKAFLQGFIAAESGKSVEDSPYEWGTPKHDDWWEGWMLATYD